MILLATLNPGPLMIYFGQEIGESGLYKEGFSGVDGRTTIFDYWALPKFNKWVNDGKFDGGGLSQDQKDLRDFYSRLLNFRLNSKTVQSGAFYDLMWKNERGNLNADKIFAYLRYTEKEKLLFVLNFDFEHTHSFRLHIGEHAFQTMGSPLEGTLYISELFEKDFVDNFSMDEVLRNGLPISILPNSALIFRLEWR